RCMQSSVLGVVGHAFPRHHQDAVIYGSDAVQMRKSIGQPITCPNCSSKLLLFRARPAALDSAGFETYKRQCNWCGVWLSGVIDPSDDTFLATALDSSSD